MSNEQTFLMKPKVDFCFKELMEDAEIRKGFISALLGMKPEEFEMAAEESSYIERAYERLVKLSADDLKRMEYEAREKAIRDHTYLMNYNLKKGREEGKKEGLEQGMKAFIEICQENALPRETVFDKLAEKFSLSSEEADKFMEKYWTAE